MTKRWVVGQKLRVNRNYAKYIDQKPFNGRDGITRTPPKLNQVGVIIDVDKQGDAWVDFGDGDPDGWVFNPNWGDIVED